MDLSSDTVIATSGSSHHVWAIDKAQNEICWSTLCTIDSREESKVHSLIEGQEFHVVYGEGRSVDSSCPKAARTSFEFPDLVSPQPQLSEGEVFLFLYRVPLSNTLRNPPVFAHCTNTWGPVSGRAYCAPLNLFFSSPVHRPNMPRDPLIGLVGKPSSGKSTTLNRCDTTIVCKIRLRILTGPSLTDASSKVGQFSPNQPSLA